MIQKRLRKSSMSGLLKDVAFITILAIFFFVVVGKFGGYIGDYITKMSCKSIDEKYVQGKHPGDGVCIRSKGNVDIKK